MNYWPNKMKISLYKKFVLSLVIGVGVLILGIQYSTNRVVGNDEVEMEFSSRQLLSPAVNRTPFTKTISQKFLGENTFHLTRCGPKTGNQVDLLCMPPPSFLDNYKNPCWMKGQRLRCYPYFQLIGMDKCGSSDLFDRIAKHPDIYGNKGVLGKETQWWPWKKYGLFLMHKIKIETFDDYLAYFDQSTKSIESKVDQAGYHYGITGDGTPMDAWDLAGWPQIPQNAGLKEPMFLTPHLIKHVSPNTKLIVIMRDPIERLFSDYFFLGLGGTTPEHFHTAVVKSVGFLKECMKTNSLRICLYDRQMQLKWNKQARIHLGFYYVFVAEWLAVFPRKQFLFLKTEEYAQNITVVLSQTYNFLEVRPLTPQEYQSYKIDIKSRKHTTKRKTKRAMLNTTRQILQELYQPFNLQLAKLLNDDAFAWNS